MSERNFFEFLAGIPDWAFYSGGALAVLFLLLTMLVILKRPSQKSAQQDAKFLASRTWYITQMDVSPKLVSLKLQSTGGYNRFMGISSNHPDFQRVSELSRMNSIKFQYQDEPIQGMENINRGAYLRIAQAGSIW